MNNDGTAITFKYGSCLKKLSYFQIEQNKRLAKLRMMDLLLLK